jgi:hypothetical protein
MEAIVAITLMALILTPLAAMVFKLTARSHRIVGSTYMNGVRMQEVNYLEAVPYDSLTDGTFTTSVAYPTFPYTKKVIVAQYYQKYMLKAKNVTLIITPTNTIYKPDTTKFIRSSANTMTTFIDDRQ